MQTKKIYRFYFVFLFIISFVFCNAQQMGFDVQSKSAARYEIDAKRAGVNPTDKDALPRSREFIRLDSTYYVGWMFEGIYKYSHSADYLGYKNAIPALQKSFDFLIRDYGKNLKQVYSDVYVFQQYQYRYGDLLYIAEALKECYDNIEMPDSVMAVLNDIDAFHFKKDFFGTSYHRAWTYHRNRFLTSRNYSFLKNSVAENEKMAFQWCYTGLARIERYKADNDQWFGSTQSEGDKLAIYHYLALLHCYNRNYDSSEYYYQQLVEGGGVSWNNYGGMQSEIGNLGTATAYFEKDQDKNFLPGMLREPYYYVPELFVYAARTKDAINMAQSIINGVGSTPGFGWYNIALARAYLYDGQLDSCEAALNKAANFKELHIGTTLTQSQYDFTINLLRVQLYDKRIAQEKFLNKGWWYSPASLYNIAAYKSQKVMQEYVVVNQLIYNPERDRMMYDLFCAEATTSFDEAWYLLKDFSPVYFTKKYQDYQTHDKRTNLQRYFKLYTAKFEWQNGKEDDARKIMEDIDHSVLLDTASEKLFVARLFEALSNAYYENGDAANLARYRNLFLEEYPQLVPFSGLRIPFKLTVSGVDDANTKQVINEIKDCNIQWADNANSNTANASIYFEKRGDKYQATINVQSGNGKKIVQNQKLIFKNPQGAGSEIALRLFGKGGALVFEPPQPVQPPKPSAK